MSIQTLLGRVAELAETQPDRPAVSFRTETLTYAALLAKAAGIAAALTQMGIRPGDRVLFTALSKPEMAACYLGLSHIGAVSVFIDKNSTPQNALAVYDDAEAVLFLTDRPLGEIDAHYRIASLKSIYADAQDKQAPARYQPEPEELSEILFTTGTTGKPKGVMLSYRSVYHILTNTVRGIGIREDDVILLPLPLNHSFALRVLRAVLYQGACVVLQNGFVFAREVEKNIDQFHCTGFAGVPVSMEILRGQMQDHFEEIMGRFRYIEIGAGSLTVEQRKRLTRTLPDTVIYNTWGSSETGGVFFLNVTEAAKDENQVRSLGKPLPGIEVRVEGEDGTPIVTDPEHPGKMSLKGDMEMVGYWHNETATAETLKDGWLVTSDLVYQDAEGFVYMLGRSDDLINVGGDKVSPIEVEGFASEYPHLSDCACIGVPDPGSGLGEVPALFVVAKDAGYSPDGLKVYLSSKVEKCKVPVHYVSVEEIPRNRMKKIDRKALRKLWYEMGEDSLMNPVIQAILSRRSIRKFTDREIDPRVLDMILKGGYHAPSGHNMQTWRFTVLTDAASIRKLKEAAREAAAANKVGFYGFDEPKCLILISNDERNPDGCQDCSAAAENIFLAAYSYGIASCWLNPLMTLRHAAPVADVLTGFGIPENHVVWCAAALGYTETEGSKLAKKKDVIHFVDK